MGAFRRAQPSWLAVLFSLAAIAIMAAVGSFAIKNFRNLQMDAFSTVGSAFIDGLLAPYARSYSHGFDTEPARLAIQHALDKPEHSNTLALLRIWQRDGSILYSSKSGVGIEDHDHDDMQRAFAGEIVVRLEAHPPANPEKGIPYPHFEIYAPIHDPETGNTLVVGELYQEASELLADRTFVERTTWAAILAATFGVLALLTLSFRQSSQLLVKLEAETRLLTQNLRLRLEADRARLDAVQANEQVLNMVGAELHDGPIQLLSLVALVPSEDKTPVLPDGTSREDLTIKVVQQLRAVAAGLILPELEGLSAAEIVELAVQRHRGLTDHDVKTELTDLPETLGPAHGVCLFRVVQEGLTNAFRHSEESGVGLSVSAQDGHIAIRIQSGPAKQRDRQARTEPAIGLGLQAIRRRLDTVGGTIRLDRRTETTLLQVRIPIGAA